MRNASRKRFPHRHTPIGRARARLRACVWLCFLLAPTGAAADGLSLGDAVRVALRQGTDARIARLETGRAGDALEQRRGGYLPQLSVVAQAGYSNRQEEKLKAVDASGTEKEYGLASIGGAQDGWANIYIDQVLFDLNKLRLIQRDELSSEATRLAELHKNETVAHVVTQRFARLLAAQQLEDIAGERIGHAEWLDEQASRLLDAGRALDVDRDQAALYLEDAQMEKMIRRGDVSDARARLWLVMRGEGGEPPGAVILDASSVPDPVDEVGEPGLEELAQAPDMRILELRQRIEETTVDAERAKRYPTFALRGGYSHYGLFRFDDFDDQAFVFLGMQLPIFDGFQTRRAVAGAAKSAEIQRLRYREALDRKGARVRELRRRLTTAGDRQSIAERALDTSLKRQQLADLNLKSGRGSIERALVARERAARDAVRAIEARRGRIELWAALQYELGRLAAALGASAPAGS